MMIAHLGELGEVDAGLEQMPNKTGSVVWGEEARVLETPSGWGDACNCRGGSR